MSTPAPAPPSRRQLGPNPSSAAVRPTLLSLPITPPPEQATGKAARPTTMAAAGPSQDEGVAVAGLPAVVVWRCRGSGVVVAALGEQRGVRMGHLLLSWHRGPELIRPKGVGGRCLLVLGGGGGFGSYTIGVGSGVPWAAARLDLRRLDQVAEDGEVQVEGR